MHHPGILIILILFFVGLLLVIMGLVEVPENKDGLSLFDIIEFDPKPWCVTRDEWHRRRYGDD